ncbi:MAG: hypothetical protein M1816_002875 [Peltula sp. TS41687]|nr:MAG: hypothetical protein M1816_002875 [Peltula sp. TS41687]
MLLLLQPLLLLLLLLLSLLGRTTILSLPLEHASAARLEAATDEQHLHRHVRRGVVGRWFKNVGTQAYAKVSRLWSIPPRSRAGEEMIQEELRSSGKVQDFERLAGHFETLQTLYTICLEGKVKTTHPISIGYKKEDSQHSTEEVEKMKNECIDQLEPLYKPAFKEFGKWTRARSKARDAAAAQAKKDSAQNGFKSLMTGPIQKVKGFTHAVGSVNGNNHGGTFKAAPGRIGGGVSPPIGQFALP